MPKTKGAKKAMKNFKDQYGDEGESIYYATANKQGRDKKTFHKECILKQDVFIEHNGVMITIPEGTVLQEFAMGTGAIAMGQGGSFNVGSHPKGGGVAMDKPEKSSVGKKTKKKKEKEKVTESANDAREAAELLKKDFAEWTGGYKPEHEKQIRRYFATSSPIKNKMFVFKILTDWMNEPDEEVEENSNSQVSPLNQDY